MLLRGYFGMIVSFRDKRTAAIFEGHYPRRGFPSELLGISRRKLGWLDAAKSLNDLRVPPGNELEALKDDRVGQHSIRINDKWRICFVWNGGSVEDVEITDYH
jgi:proteic killer suppression protein